jgi:hypothetical protein
VARGLENKGEGLIYCRMLRRHYGTPISELFTPLKHEERDGYVDELTGEKFAKGELAHSVSRIDIHKGFRA